MKKTILVTGLLLVASSALAQAPAPQGTNPVSKAIRDILPGREKNTVAAVEAMPADKFGFKPTADQRTFGQLVVHMVETNYLLCGKFAAVPPPKLEEVKETDPKEKLVSGLTASFNFCSDSLAKVDDSNLGETTEVFGKQVTRAWLGLILSRRMGRPLQRGCIVPALEWYIATHREEVAHH